MAVTQVPDGDDPSQYNILVDKLSVYVAVDSPVDLADIDFSSTITYASITNPTGNEEFEHHVRPHVEIYPYANTSTGIAQTTLPANPSILLAVKATPEAANDISTVNAVITVKSVDGLDAKFDVPLTVSGDTASTPAPVALGAIGGPADKWVEVMIRDDVFGRDGLTLEKFVTVAGTPTVETPIPNAVLRWSGMQGIFPQPYRGWGIAGYTAGEGLRDVPMAESAFVIDPASFPTPTSRSADPRRRLAGRGAHRAVVRVHPGRGTRRRHDRRARHHRPLGRAAGHPLRRRHHDQHLPARRRQRRLLRASRRRRRAADARRRRGSASAGPGSRSASASARSAPPPACRRASG